MKATIVYDNEPATGLESGWGFSCLIEAHEKKILFDTGDDGNKLMFNLRSLKIKPEEIGMIFLSHSHGDHTGGLSAFLRMRKGVPVYVPSSFSESLKSEIGKLAELHETTKAEEISDGIFTTGELENGTKEQSLFVKTEKGIVAICGCSHPGVDNIVEKAKEFGNVYAVMGGFHGFSNLGYLKDLELIVPCHCTEKKQEILEMYPEKSKLGKTGMAIEV